LIAAAVVAAKTRAAPNYMPLTRQANNLVFNVDETAWPLGPHAQPQVPRASSVP
jgi:hypothetical protein